MKKNLPLTRLIRRTLGVTGALGAAALLAPTQVLAQDDERSASASAMLDEVTVTARRREERLLDQPSGDSPQEQER